MSRDPDRLDPMFKEKHFNLIQECKEAGIELVTYFTTRDPFDQARLWRQSRSFEEVILAIAMLRKQNADWLADILGGVGKQYGRWATNCLPGQSYHQFGLASDNCIKFEGKLVWEEKDPGYHLYEKYAWIAGTLGLTCGLNWKRKDPCHVQFGDGNLLKVYTWKSINQIMKIKWRRRNND